MQSTRDGSWPGYEGNGTGNTALVTLSLLNAGMAPTHPRIVLAMDYLRANEPTRTYETALQIMVFSAASPKQDLERIRRLAKKLEDGQQEDNGWTYDISDFDGKPLAAVPRMNRTPNSQHLACGKLSALAYP